jgi:hypothetical protein
MNKDVSESIESNLTKSNVINKQKEPINSLKSDFLLGLIGKEFFE